MKGELPLRVRLLCVRRRKKGESKSQDVWLMTNVLDATRLSVAQAGQMYRWRWENEGLFRTFKRTLAKVKLTSRTLALIHREAEAAGSGRGSRILHHRARVESSLMPSFRLRLFAAAIAAEGQDGFRFAVDHVAGNGAADDFQSGRNFVHEVHHRFLEHALMPFPLLPFFQAI